MCSSLPDNAYKYPIEKMLTLNTMDERMKETLDAWLKYGTVFLIYRLCTYYFFDRENENAELFDKESLRLVFFILLGFTIYYLLVKPYIPIHLQHPIINNIANDSLMFGTVLVSSHIMETFMNNGEYFNTQWLKSAGLILLSFAAYRVFINPFIPLKNMKLNNASLVSDWAQFGTFLIVLRLLENKTIFDKKWALSILFVLLGFTGYHLITKKIIIVD
uniref:Uncharacterized protein n=1 Tax=viral metagenome TaxID=1070528 RepID=A0A6C0LS30_9ZZZZ